MRVVFTKEQLEKKIEKTIPVKKKRPVKRNPAKKKKSTKGKKVPTRNPHIAGADDGNRPVYSIGRPSRYDSKHHDLIGAFMSRDGWSVKRMCAEFGIGKDAFYAWREKYPSFNEAVRYGRDYIDKQVENSLLKSALGWVETYEEVSKEYESIAAELVDITDGANPVYNELPNTLKEVKTKRTTKRQVFKPDVNAIKFWLSNRKDAHWKNSKDTMTHSGKIQTEVIDAPQDLTGLSMDELKALQTITAKIEGKK